MGATRSMKNYNDKIYTRHNGDKFEIKLDEFY